MSDKQKEFWDAILSGLINTYRQDAALLIENQLIHINDLDFDASMRAKIQSVLSVAIRRTFPMDSPNEDFFLYDFFDVSVLEERNQNIDDLNTITYADLGVDLIEEVDEDDEDEMDELGEQAELISDCIKDTIFELMSSCMLKLAKKNKKEVFKYDHWFHRNKPEKTKAGYLYKTILSLRDKFDKLDMEGDTFIVTTPSVVTFLSTLSEFDDKGLDEATFYCGMLDDICVYMAPSGDEDFVIVGNTENNVSFNPCTLAFIDEKTSQLSMNYTFTTDVQSHKSFRFIELKNFDPDSEWGI